MYQDFRILLSQCYAQMKISFPGLIFAQYKSINIIIIIIIIIIILLSIVRDLQVINTFSLFFFKMFCTYISVLLMRLDCVTHI